MVAKSIAKMYTNIHKPTDYKGCLKKTRNQCQPRGYKFDHDGCAQMYSNHIVKVLLNNSPKTDFK